MKNSLVAVLTVAMLVLGSGAGYFASQNSQNTRVVTSTTTVANVTSNSVFHSNVFLMNVNGSLYYADDVSDDTVVQNPGYGYLNGSVTFSGVKFQTNCPAIYSGCPVSASNTITSRITVLAGDVNTNATFPDGVTERIPLLIGDLTYALALSHHSSPRAGILVESVFYPPDARSLHFKVFLLVSS
jgi:hypothetical protein